MIRGSLILAICLTIVGQVAAAELELTVEHHTAEGRTPILVTHMRGERLMVLRAGSEPWQRSISPEERAALLANVRQAISHILASDLTSPVASDSDFYRIEAEIDLPSGGAAAAVQTPSLPAWLEQVSAALAFAPPVP